MTGLPWVAEALTMLPDDELVQLHRAVTVVPEAFVLSGRARVGAWYLALDFVLTAECVRRGGGDASSPVDVLDHLRQATAELDLMEQVHLGQNLTRLRDDAPPEAAPFFAALLAPIRAALDVRAARA